MALHRVWPPAGRALREVDARSRRPGSRSVLLTGSGPPRSAASTRRAAPGRPTRTIGFAAFDGVTRIDPRLLTVNERPPPVHTQRITANGEDHRASDAATGPLRLPSGQGALPHQARGAGRRRELVHERRTRYTNLRPGEYRFLVNAANNSGAWSRARAVAFTIAATTFETAWFRARCLAEGLALLASAYDVRGAVPRRRARALARATPAGDHRAQRTPHEGAGGGALEDRGQLHDAIVQQLSMVALLRGAAKRILPPESGALARHRGVAGAAHRNGIGAPATVSRAPPGRARTRDRRRPSRPAARSSA